MKYVSVDIETTGLNHDVCQIIEFAAIADDLKTQQPIESLPTFQTYILHDHYIGEPAALAMHCDIFKKITNWKKLGINVCAVSDLLPKFHTFLTTLCGYNTATNAFQWMDGAIKINIAGKNFGNFDSKFLEKLPNYGLFVKFNHRILDPAMLYFDPEEDTETLPSTEVCMKRARIDVEVKHTALEDAINIIKLLRRKYPIKRN